MKLPLVEPGTSGWIEQRGTLASGWIERRGAFANPPEAWERGLNEPPRPCDLVRLGLRILTAKPHNYGYRVLGLSNRYSTDRTMGDKAAQSITRASMTPTCRALPAHAHAGQEPSLIAAQLR